MEMFFFLRVEINIKLKISGKYSRLGNGLYQGFVTFNPESHVCLWSRKKKCSKTERKFCLKKKKIKIKLIFYFCF